ncbi:long-chain fatty acid--CoA ligase [Kocuria sp. JC486]|uniref:AMP-dependent synthetase/ligase n=1 Tax=Kocuria sp. JC486 TaxID=1970736 RepID=UPI001422BD7B|nr:AMP-dependent synthetase/ligase [Kocuria sp. JC486]NHU85686.1 long-chain fatty acid--CoA ligase [Kocuria sp. JC486]
MSEIALPRLVETPATSNTTDLLVRNARKASDPALFSRREGDQWVGIPASRVLADVIALAKGFVAAGVQPGDRVALMSRNRLEWSLLDFAVWFAGGVVVPVYESSAPTQLAWNLSDSGAVGLVVETAEHKGVWERAAHNEDLSAVHSVWCLDEGAVGHLTEGGKDVPDEEVERRRRIAGLDDLATVIYTSGTTGRPKGCELTHGNFVELSENAAASIPEAVHEGARTVMFLPLAHVFARFIQVMAVGAGVNIAHTSDIKSLLDDLKSFEPTFLLVVPRVFEKVYNSAQQKAEAGGKGKIFDRAAAVAIEWSRAEEQGKVPLTLKVQHALFDKLVYGKLREAMGGKVKYAVSGGGPLGERLGHFFHGIGLRVLEGYGLTETTAPITVNTAKKIKIGTVGTVLPGNSVKISDDGEVLAKGICVMRGYWNNPEKTAEAFDDDGWFRTGDLGSLDQDGYLKITGRIKELIVTAGGKNVSPVVLEDQVRAHPLVSQCIAVGEKRPFIAALVTLDEEALPGWLDAHGFDASMTVAQAREDEHVKKAVEEAIEHANQAVSRAEQIREFRILEHDFSEADGTLTPSLKLRRRHVLVNNEELIDEIYGGALQHE